MAIKFIKIKYWFGFSAFTLYPFIFYVDTLDSTTRRHELVHIDQQRKWAKWWNLWVFGLFAWFFCYLALLPVGINPFRYKWEHEAFTKGSGYSNDLANTVIKEQYYLWFH